MIHTNDKVIKHKVGLLNLAEELGNVSKACKMMGLSRDTFYRYKAANDEGGVCQGSCPFYYVTCFSIPLCFCLMAKPSFSGFNHTPDTGSRCLIS